MASLWAARMRAACSNSVSPAGVNSKERPFFRNNGCPTVDSSRFICMLTAAWVINKDSPARVKLPVSATVENVLKRSMGNSISIINAPYGNDKTNSLDLWIDVY